MGKGGEQPVANATSGKKAFKALKLEHMPTEELRKWAKAYNVDSEKKREDLLQLLVRIMSMFLSTSDQPLFC